MKKPFLLAVFALAGASLLAQSADEIVRKADTIQKFDTLKTEGSIVTTDRFGKKRSDYISWNRDQEFLIEFTNIEELGQKILRTEDEIYLYYPDSENIIRLQGAALRQSMVGSDISYEDMTEGKDKLDKYEAVLLGEELYDGKTCYKVELTAKVKNVPYPKQVLWVEKESYITHKYEAYSQSDRLLKEMVVSDIEMVGEKYLITRMVIADKMKSNSSTEMIVANFQVDIPISRRFFSTSELY